MGRKIKEIQYNDGKADISGDEGYEVDDKIDVDECLDFLLEDKEPESSIDRRDEAFELIIKALEQYELLDNTVISIILHQSLNTIYESNSPSETALAARIIGLVALTAGPGDQEIYEILKNSVDVIVSKFLWYSDSTIKSSLVDCLAILNFVCDDGVEYVDKKLSIEFIWEKVSESSGSSRVSALLAFAFFLSTSNESFTLEEYWVKATICSLLSMLDSAQSAIRTIAGEVIALILERKGSDKLNENVASQFLQKSKSILAESTGKKNLRSERRTFNGIVQFLEKETFLRKDDGILEGNEWGNMMKLMFLKHFLGEEGFKQHVQKNEFMRRVLRGVLGGLGGSEDMWHQKKLVKKTDSSRWELRVECIRMCRMYFRKKKANGGKAKNWNKDRDLKVHLLQQ